VFADLANNAAFAPWRRAALERGFRSVVSVPLRDGGRTFGVLCMYAGVVHAPPQAELDLLQELADDLAFGIRHLRTRAEQQRVQDAVLKIASAVSVRVSTSFFERLVSSLAEAVGASAAFIVRAHPKCASQRRTIVAVVDGVTLENFDFDAAGTPCDDVGPDGPFVVPARLPSRYDDCEMVKLSSAQALLEWRLDDAAGTQLATMFVLFREPLAELDFMTSTLQIFVTRAAAELERQIADTRIADQAAWLDRARDAIVVRDLNGSISFWNEGAERLYGWSSVEMCGTPRGAAFFNDTGRSHDVTSDVVIDGYWNGDVEHMRKDGTIVWVESRSTIVTDDDGEPRSILSIDTDITQRNAAEREIEHLAFYDALTNLPNRLMLVKGLQAALATCAGYGSLLFIDVDNFKTLNDTLGHDKGDLLLRQVALRLQACVGASDIVARFGGDEFVVVFDGLGGVHDGARETARAISKKILATFNAPFQLDGYEHTSTSSIGVTLFTSADNVDDLLKQADLAMYQAKAAGRNSLRFFDPQMQATVTLRRALENDLRTAIGANAFAVAYQPQVDSRGSVIGAEALVRWSHSRRGPVSPAEFIPIAEDSGLIVPLGRWILRTACTQLVRWSGAMPKLKLSVNVSAREFRHPDFVSTVIETLAVTGAAPRRLMLELTESVLVDDVDVVIAKMTALRKLGVAFSLDDFGTGYSSLSYLKRLPLNQLKIDQSFVRDVLVDSNDAVIARTIVALGQSLSLDVIAEGVETIEQRDFLKSVGCRSYQGYLFSRPLAPQAFAAFFAEFDIYEK